MSLINEIVGGNLSHFVTSQIIPRLQLTRGRMDSKRPRKEFYYFAAEF